MNGTGCSVYEGSPPRNPDVSGTILRAFRLLRRGATACLWNPRLRDESELARAFGGRAGVTVPIVLTNLGAPRPTMADEFPDDVERMAETVDREGCLNAPVSVHREVESIVIIGGACIRLVLGDPQLDGDDRSDADTASADDTTIVVTGDDLGKDAQLCVVAPASIRVGEGSSVELSGVADRLELAVTAGGRVDASLLRIGDLVVALEQCAVVAPDAQRVTGWVTYGAVIEVGTDACVDGLLTANAGRIVRPSP